MKCIALCLAHSKATIAPQGKSILSLFVLFADVLHEDSVFQTLRHTVDSDAADVAWDG